MPAFTENLALFFRVGDPGVSEVSYTPPGYPHPNSVNTVTVAGHYRRDYVQAGESEGFAPVFTCRKASVPGIKHGAKFTIDGAVFRVVGIHDDGMGIVKLVLEEQ